MTLQTICINIVVFVLAGATGSVLYAAIRSKDIDMLSMRLDYVERNVHEHGHMLHGPGGLGTLSRQICRLMAEHGDKKPGADVRDVICPSVWHSGHTALNLWRGCGRECGQQKADCWQRWDEQEAK
jgi:hypothetical protein